MVGLQISGVLAAPQLRWPQGIHRGRSCLTDSLRCSSSPTALIPRLCLMVSRWRVIASSRPASPVILLADLLPRSCFRMLSLKIKNFHILDMMEPLSFRDIPCAEIILVGRCKICLVMPTRNLLGTLHFLGAGGISIRPLTSMAP